jgi:hypothetical protein
VGDRRGGDRHCDHVLLALDLNCPEQTFPDVGRLCVLLPIRTENRLRFSVHLDDGVPEVRFERVAVS